MELNTLIQRIKSLSGINPRHILKVLIACVFGIVFVNSKAQNPIIRDIYTADPSAHVWGDGRLYVYPSHDIDPPRGCDLMDQYHVYSTDDMIHWTDHGEILRASQVEWGRQDGGFMWAPDCVFKNGVYYFYFPHPSETEWNNSWKIGIATSTEPAANFVVKGYIGGLKSMIDPCAFVDDDGKAYLYYGGGGHCEGGKLKDNMVEVDGEMHVMEGLQDFHEATWVHKHNGIYYLSYSDNNSKGGNQMRYATSNNPLGPWTYKGIYMEPTGSSTNHGSIVEFKGQWYAFYHNSILSGNDWLRSVSVDPLYYNDDGTIQKVIQTRAHGTPYNELPLPIPGIIEAEQFDKGGQGAAYSDNDKTNSGGQFRPDEGVDIEKSSVDGYSIGWTNGGEWMEYTVNIRESSEYNVKAVIASPDGNSSIRLKVDGKDITSSILIKATGGWQNFDSVSVRTIKLETGPHILQLIEETGGFNIDKLIFLKASLNTGISDLIRKNKFQLFPNPAAHSFTILSPAEITTLSRIDIYDLQGKKVQTVLPSGTTRNIIVDINDLRPGNYLVKIISNQIFQTEKLIIK
jgi:hypothetical protein